MWPLVGQLPGRDRARGRSLGDQRAPHSGEAVREQAGQRDVVVVGIGEVGATVGERVARRLEVVVQRPRAVGRRERQALEDVQRLADGRAAARRRAHAPHVKALVADARRVAPHRVVLAQVALGHQPRPPEVVGVRGDRRVLGGSRDRAGDRAGVERALAEAGDQLVGAREVGVAQRGADVARRAVGIEVDRRRRRHVVEEVDVGLRLAEERLVDDEAAAGDVDRRLQELVEPFRAVAVERLVPLRDRAGHAGRQAAPASVGEGERRAVLDERLRMHCVRRLLAPVDRGHVALRRADHHEAAAADAGRERLGYAEHSGRGDGGVDGVAPVPQGVDRRLGGERVDGSRRAAAANGGRLLHELVPVICLRHRSRERRGRERRGEDPAHHRSPPTLKGGQTPLVRLAVPRGVRPPYSVSSERTRTRCTSGPRARSRPRGGGRRPG